MMRIPPQILQNSMVIGSNNIIVLISLSAVMSSYPPPPHCVLTGKDRKPELSARQRHPDSHRGSHRGGGWSENGLADHHYKLKHKTWNLPSECYDFTMHGLVHHKNLEKNNLEIETIIIWNQLNKI